MKCGIKFIWVIVLTACFLGTHTIDTFAEEQQQGQKESAYVQSMPAKPSTKLAEDPQESTDTPASRIDKEDAEWQSIKIDKPATKDVTSGNSCPCDSTGVRSRLTRMGGMTGNDSSQGYGGRGMGGGMGRGRR